MKLFRAIILFIFAGTLATRADLPAGWSTNFTATLAEATARQEPVLVYFTASWCGPCKLMSQIILTDPAVLQTLSSIKHVAVDIDENRGIASKLGITGVPTLILLSANTEEVQRISGVQPVGDFLNWLTNGVAEANAAAIQLVIFRDKLEVVDQLLLSTNDDATHQVARELFELCAVRNQTLIQAATTRLHTLAARDPVRLLDGLNDRRLATRIQVANALRARFGETIAFDAWSDAIQRSQAVEALRTKLAPVNNVIKAP